MTFNLGKSYRMPKSHCLECGNKLDAAGGVGTNDHPQPGNVSVCINCMALALYDDDLKLRRPTPEELQEMMQDEDVQVALLTLAQAPWIKEQ